MPRFVYAEEDRGYVLLDAKPGEEIPVEMAQAWALIRLGNVAELGVNVHGTLVDAVKDLKSE
jgi:hypothetical protein